jgi:hypothetical protein
VERFEAVRGRRRRPSAHPAATGRDGRNSVKTSRNRRGIALAWTAIILFVMIGIVGLSIDWGKVVWNAHQIQNAADAASLAAAAYVRSGYLLSRDPTQTYPYEDSYPYIVYKNGKLLAQANHVEGVGLELDVSDLSGFDPNADIVIGYWHRESRTFTPFNLDDPLARRAPNAARAIGRRTVQSPVNQPLSLLFGPIFGTQTADATRLCTTMDEGSSGAGLITLLEKPKLGCGLNIGGNAGLIVNGGDIHDNAEGGVQPGFWCQNNSLEIDCENLTVNGTANPDGGMSFNINADSGIVLPDPLRKVPALWGPPLQAGGVPTPPAPPGYVALPDYGCAVQYDAVSGTYVDVPGFNAQDPDPRQIQGTMILRPGYYPGGIRISQGDNITLLPGVYAFGGGDGTQGDSGLCVSEGAVLNAEGVMVYVTASNTMKGGKPIWGKISLTGGEVTIKEKYGGEETPVPYSGYEGSQFEFISIYLDRATDPDNEVDITGGPSFLLKGTLYFPTVYVKFTGGAINAGTQLVAGSVGFEGTGVVTINYDGRFVSSGSKLAIVE